MRNVLFILVISFICLSSSAQVKLDSLIGEWNNSHNSDTARLAAYRDWIKNAVLFSQPDSAFASAELLYDFANTVGEERYKAEARNIQGISYAIRGKNEKALEYFNLSVIIYRRTNNLSGLGAGLNNLGNLYYSTDQDTMALEMFKESIEIREKINDQYGLASCACNSGHIYNKWGDFKNAIELYSKCLEIAERIQNKELVASSKLAFATIYKDQGEYDLSLKYSLESYREYEEIGNDVSAMSALTIVGNNYKNTGNLVKSLECHNAVLEKGRSIKAIKNIGTAYTNISSTYLEMIDSDDFEFNKLEIDSLLSICKQASDSARIIGEQISNQEILSGALSSLMEISFLRKDYSAAYELALLAIKHSEAANDLTNNRHASYQAYEVSKIVGNDELALYHYEQYISLNDSLQRSDNQKAVIRQEYKYQYEKQAAADSIKSAEETKVKDAQLAAEQAENKQHELAAKQQEEQKMYLYGGLGLALLFGGFIFNRFRVTRKQKDIIEEQKHKVDEAYDELEEKNTEILDSINYAKRIQSAILPPSKLVKEYLNQSFILYKPKDIVAGDFYWMEPFQGEERGAGGVLFAAADCTGHGVPGAMVSVVCNSGLNRSVREHGLTDPGEILTKTREIVISEFEKSEEEVKDGMDIALCSLEGSTLKYAGAHNPLWIIRKNSQEVEEIKADKQPIGKYDDPKPYKTHRVELQKGDTFYTFSDGYADQFGGDKGKKLKAKNFKTLLLSIQNETMERQRELIDEAFEKWKGSFEQLDDVCVIGVRL